MLIGLVTSSLLRDGLEGMFCVAIGGMLVSVVKNFRSGELRANLCPQCGRPTSSAYPQCRHCGAPLSGRRS